MADTAGKAPLLLLIDGSHAVFRAFFAIRHLASPSGQPTGAVFGFSSMLLKLLRDYRPARVAVCFDTSGPTWRHALSDSYKANRPDMPEELQVQWPICQRIAQELGLPMLKLDGQEADDLIATLAHRGHRAGFEVLVVSGDKDLMQLVVDGAPAIRQLDDGKGQIYDEAGVTAKWGVAPRQIGDLLAIMGDSVDNIAGVRGIGEKGAAKLLQQWQTLEEIWAHLDQVTPPRTQELLKAGKPAADLARELVKLECHADLPWSLDDLLPLPADRAKLAQSFADLGFRRLTAEYVDALPSTEAPSGVRIAGPDDLGQIAAILKQSKAVALWAVTDLADAERTRPCYGKLTGLALAVDPAMAWYLPIGHALELGGPPNLPLALVQAQLGELLSDPRLAKLGCGIKYELLVMESAGLPLAGVVGDAMLASYLVDPEAHSHDLRSLAHALLATSLAADDTALKAGGKGKAQTGWDQVTAATAAALLGPRPCAILKLWALLQPKLAEARVAELYSQLELPLSQVLADMERLGIGLDCEELARQSAWLATEIASEQAQIWQLAGEQFNIGSPQQLGRVLFESLGLPAKKKTQSGWSTDQSVLEGLEDKHAVAARVLRWRQLTKLRSTYTEMLPQMVLPQTGRVHTWFHQAVAATGRLSSIDPNLQNIPIRSTEGRRIRSAFVAASGRVLVSADYSQIELRVMAHLADDPGLQEAFAKGVDIHRETAARMFNLLPELVEPSQRSAAKTINFGILYGMGPQRLSREIGVSLKEAKGFIDTYFERFPAVHRWMDGVLSQARATGEVRTLLGRRRPVPGLASANPAERAGAERIAVNTPVQGTAADLIKRAMLLVRAELDTAGLKADLLLQVHDELVLECDEASAPAVAQAVRTAMLRAGQSIPTEEHGCVDLKAPLQVDVRWGHSWADAH